LAAGCRAPLLMCGSIYGTITEAGERWGSVKSSSGWPGNHLETSASQKRVASPGAWALNRYGGRAAVTQVFKKPGRRGLINLQNRGGEAIEYQVRQILNLAEELGLLED